ncbi:MAG: DNA mismatch repair endonuclease MutL [Ruminococcus sp.]|nr:DNA mismatch repair endonuclease MutL [Ruminococcus sp.]
MAQITVLSKEISELIAAGEVIERPSSVIKEVVENAIDAGAEHITVEIKRGGTTYMRITDDGCGMAPEDVPTAFLRHATSKISGKDDLEHIYTLGFRGEALASISAVARVSLLTKRREDAYGTRYAINGSVPEGEPEQTGCPNGTTIIIRDLFYNVPVRQRFMKKDVTEANAVSQIVQKIALSHPEVAFQMIRDNRMEFCTDGSDDLYAAIYAIYGKEFAHDLIAVEYDDGYVHVTGYVCKPLYAKSNRSFQNFFINGRFVRSRVCSVALEGAYENLIMTGKFPSCVLMVTMNASDLDVNVHPAKAEVRFTNEKLVTDGLFFAVKNALMKNGLIYEFQIRQSKPVTDWTAPILEEPIYEQQPLPEVHVPVQTPVEEYVPFESVLAQQESVRRKNDFVITSPSLPEQEIPEEQQEEIFVDVSELREDIRVDSWAALDSEQSAAEEKKSVPALQKETAAEPEREAAVIPAIDPIDIPKPAGTIQPAVQAVQTEPKQPAIRVIGELFKNYILAEAEGQMVIFDKHAAHERVLFERLKSGQARHYRQMLMTPARTLLAADEIDALQNHTELLLSMGFSFDFSEVPYVRTTGVPTFAQELNLDEIVTEIAHNLVLGKTNPQPEYLDDTLHTIACKAAVKANDRNELIELQKLAEEVYGNEKIRHCPHGRPVMFVVTKHELEKQFRRV